MKKLLSDRPELVVESSTTLCDVSTLYDTEHQTIINAVTSRQREFATGRACARQALRQLGIEGFAITVGPDKEPVWPDSIVGSITHCKGYCAAAVASNHHILGIGIDAELHQPLSDTVIKSVCRPEELAWITTRTVATEPHWPTVLFSAKECVHKCYFPINGLQLGFQDVIVTPDPVNNEFTVDLVNRPPHATVDIRQFRGRYAIEEPWIFTAIILDDP